jgi:hypothetical protein
MFREITDEPNYQLDKMAEKTYIMPNKDKLATNIEFQKNTGNDS